MGFRERVMGIPWVYKYFSLGISKPESGVWFANEIISAAPKARILDVGCGPADVVSRLGDVSYRRLITFDCAVDRGQHPIARILARLDSGRYARTTDRYRELVSKHLTPVEVVVRHGLLRVPYTHTIITAVPNT